MLSQDLASSRLRISAVLGKSSFDQALLARVDDVYDAALRVIYKHLRKVGEAAVQAAKDNIIESTPTGIKYIYLNDDGSVAKTHIASQEGQPPASASGDLLNAITFRANPDGWVEVGVYSDEEGGWPTKAFLGYGNAEMRREHGVAKGGNTMFVRYGGSKHTEIKQYALWLEYGSPGGKIKARPFLHPAMVSTVADLNTELRISMKEALLSRIRRKNAKISFRFKMTR